VAQKLAEPGALQERGEIETVLDEVEYLFEVLEPEMQDGAERLIAELRARLERAG
jgi:hypothetical protein